MFKLTILPIVATFVGLSASANAMPDARRLSCPQIQEMVSSQGAVVFRTGRHTYERVVAHAGYCSNAGDETTQPAWLPSRDGNCFAGYRCVQDNRGGGGG